jgi:hypothetical protein
MRRCEFLGYYEMAVMPGLDPGIHLASKVFLKRMDCRVKPGNDELGCERANLAASARAWLRARARSPDAAQSHGMSKTRVRTLRRVRDMRALWSGLTNLN